LIDSCSEESDSVSEAKSSTADKLDEEKKQPIGLEEEGIDDVNKAKCPSCTFLNEKESEKCVICDHRLPQDDNNNNDEDTIVSSNNNNNKSKKRKNGNVNVER